MRIRFCKRKPTLGILSAVLFSAFLLLLSWINIPNLLTRRHTLNNALCETEGIHYWKPLNEIDYRNFFRLRNYTNIKRHHFTLWKDTWMKISFKGLQGFGSRKLHKLSETEPYRSRKLDISLQCKHSSYDKTYVDLSRMIFDDSRKVVMCVVPKAACSTWKRMFWFMLGQETQKKKLHQISREIVLGKGLMQTLASLNKTEAFRRLATYTTFFVMRHPYERLVSAHSSKFTDRTSNDLFQMRYGRQIARDQSLRHMHGVPFDEKSTIINITTVKNSLEFSKLLLLEKQEVLKYVETMNTGKISFPQFVDYVISSSKQSSVELDVHWRPQTTLCNPCGINYDYIIKFEDLAVDSNRLLKFLQLGEPKERQLSLKTIHAKVGSQSVIDQFKHLDTETKLSLGDLYKNDFNILGYTQPMAK